MSRAFSSNLRGKVRNFSLPKNRPLIPLYEAIVNSINAIDERIEQIGPFQGDVEIEVIRKKTLLSDSDDNTVLGFRIQDNGIGFNEENMKSFMEADSEYKMRFGGKGVGRFSWLKAFTNVKIQSTFREDSGICVTRSFDFNLNCAEINDTLEETAEVLENKTIVELMGYLEDYEHEVPKQLNTIAIRIIQHCFVYFLRDSCPQISIFDKGEKLSLNQIFKDNFSTDNNRRSFALGKHVFDLLNIKINDRVFPHKNRLYLCANDRLVDSRDLEKIIVNLDSELYEKEGYWYLGILTSEYFDKNVDMNRLSFSIPQESSTMVPDSPGMDLIIQSASNEVQVFLKDYLDTVDRHKRERVQKFTTETAPQYRHLVYYVPEQIAALKPGLSDSELDDALYSIKRSFENKTKTECSKLIEKLKKGEITPEEYQKQFQDTIEKVSDVNSAALAEYVVHRRIILNLFNQGLEIKEDQHFNLEKYMHGLFYPMRATSDDTPYEKHNLWLIDERLSFSQFISSDKPFDNSQKEGRTDILMLDNPVVVADCENTGVAYNSIAIFEIKRPMRDDYDMENNPVTQLLRYAKKILNGEAKDNKHRPIKVTSTTQIFLYALCDITPSLKSVLDSMSFTRTPDGLGAYLYHSNYHAFVEVLSFDKIKNDSEKRNRVLFDKLGLE